MQANFEVPDTTKRGFAFVASSGSGTTVALMDRLTKLIIELDRTSFVKLLCVIPQSLDFMSCLACLESLGETAISLPCGKLSSFNRLGVLTLIYRASPLLRVCEE